MMPAAVSQTEMKMEMSWASLQQSHYSKVSQSLTVPGEVGKRDIGMLVRKDRN